MPTPGQPRQPVIGYPTRQQLDELDALMQRMLQLPVESVPEAPSSETAEQNMGYISDFRTGAVSDARSAAIGPATAGAQSGARSSALTVTRTDGPHTGPTTAAIVVSPWGSPSSKSAAAGPAPRAGTSASVQGARVPSAEKRSSAHAEPQSKAQEAPPVRGWLRPVATCNRAFDIGASYLGPAGQWLSGPAGRSFLGWTGILLLAASLAWLALEGLSWTW